MSQGAWQDWDDKEYTDYLERYYGMQLTLARTIVKDAMIDDFADLTIAVFNKIASPSVYLQPHFKMWLEKQGEKEIPELHTPPKPTNNGNGGWKKTRTEGTLWKSERDATEEEMTNAMDPAVEESWYMPPKEGYQYGAIFKKVKA